MREVAEYLGNTPAVARSSYVDPRVVDLFSDGITIAAVLAELGGAPNPQDAVAQRAVDAAVLEMLRTGEEPEEVLDATAQHLAEPAIAGRRHESVR
jgi:DNA topoisomerase IB